MSAAALGLRALQTQRRQCLEKDVYINQYRDAAGQNDQGPVIARGEQGARGAAPGAATAPGAVPQVRPTLLRQHLSQLMRLHPTAVALAIGARGRTGAGGPPWRKPLPWERRPGDPPAPTQEPGDEEGIDVRSDSRPTEGGSAISTAATAVPGASAHGCAGFHAISAAYRAAHSSAVLAGRQAAHVALLHRMEQALEQHAAANSSPMASVSGTDPHQQQAQEDIALQALDQFCMESAALPHGEGLMDQRFWCIIFYELMDDGGQPLGQQAADEVDGPLDPAALLEKLQPGLPAAHPETWGAVLRMAGRGHTAAAQVLRHAVAGCILLHEYLPPGGGSSASDPWLLAAVAAVYTLICDISDNSDGVRSNARPQPLILHHILLQLPPAAPAPRTHARDARARAASATVTLQPAAHYSPQHLSWVAHAFRDATVYLVALAGLAATLATDAPDSRALEACCARVLAFAPPGVCFGAPAAPSARTAGPGQGPAKDTAGAGSAVARKPAGLPAGESAPLRAHAARPVACGADGSTSGAAVHGWPQHPAARQPAPGELESLGIAEDLEFVLKALVRFRLLSVQPSGPVVEEYEALRANFRSPDESARLYVDQPGMVDMVCRALQRIRDRKDGQWRAHQDLMRCKPELRPLMDLALGQGVGSSALYVGRTLGSIVDGLCPGLAAVHRGTWGLVHQELWHPLDGAPPNEAMLPPEVLDYAILGLVVAQALSLPVSFVHFDICVVAGTTFYARHKRSRNRQTALLQAADCLEYLAFVPSFLELRLWGGAAPGTQQASTGPRPTPPTNLPPTHAAWQEQRAAELEAKLQVFMLDTQSDGCAVVSAITLYMRGAAQMRLAAAAEGEEEEEERLGIERNDGESARGSQVGHSGAASTGGAGHTGRGRWQEVLKRPLMDAIAFNCARHWHQQQTPAPQPAAAAARQPPRPPHPYHLQHPQHPAQQQPIQQADWPAPNAAHDPCNQCGPAATVAPAGSQGTNPGGQGDPWVGADGPDSAAANVSTSSSEAAALLTVLLRAYGIPAPCADAPPAQTAASGSRQAHRGGLPLPAPAVGAQAYSSFDVTAPGAELATLLVLMLYHAPGGDDGLQPVLFQPAPVGALPRAQSSEDRRGPQLVTVQPSGAAAMLAPQRQASAAAAGTPGAQGAALQSLRRAGIPRSQDPQPPTLGWQYSWDECRSCIVSVGAGTKVAQQLAQPRRALLQRRLGATWLQARGVGGVAGAMQLAAKLRSELAAQGRDLCMTVVDVRFAAPGEDPRTPPPSPPPSPPPKPAKPNAGAANAAATAAAPPSARPKPETVLRMDYLYTQLVNAVKDLSGDTLGDEAYAFVWSEALSLAAELLSLLRAAGCPGREGLYCEWLLLECEPGRPDRLVLPRPARGPGGAKDKLQRALFAA